MKYAIFLFILCLSSCVSKEDYNSLESENEQLEKRISELESDISIKNYRIEKLHMFHTKF